MANCIEKGIKNRRISTPMEKKSFSGKKKEIDHIEGGYKGKNTQFPKYKPPSSQVANINFNSPFSTKILENQIGNLPKNQITSSRAEILSIDRSNNPYNILKVSAQNNGPL